MLLATIVEQVAMECDLEECTVDQYRRAVSRFSAWLGTPATKEELTVEKLNAFLCSLQKQVSGTTVRNYRVSLTRVWNYLTEFYDQPEYNVRRLRRPRVERKPVQSWSQDQITALLKGCDDLLNTLRIGIPESEYMKAWILVGYDTGLRPIDMRLLRWDDIDLTSGSVSLTQHKTRNPHTALLSMQTLKALRRIVAPQRQLVFPLSKGGMRRLERKLYRESSRHGFSRMRGQGLGTLRKTHATQIYILHGECAAAESLGHVGGIRTVRASYIDSRAIKHGRLPPPPIV